jgi:putative aldouronate transport system substrate-binding protein
MRRLYEDGFLDPEYFTQTNAQLVAKAQQDLYFMYSFGSQNGIMGDAERAYDYATARPLTSSVNPEPWWPEQTPFAGDSAAIPVTSANPEKVWEILDWMGTVEGEAHNVPIILPEWYCESCVPEGLTRENVVSPPIDGVKQDPEPISDLTLFSFINKYINPAGSNVPGVRGGWEEGSRWAEPLGVQVFDIENPGHWLFISNQREIVPFFTYAVTGKDLKFTTDEQEVLTRYQADLESYMDEMHAKFVTGVESLDDFDAYIAELDRFGIQEVNAVLQAAYDRWEASR